MKNSIFVFIAILAGLLVFYLVAQQVIRYQAIDSCLKAGEARFRNADNQDLMGPDGYWYDFCMKEKGLK